MNKQSVKHSEIGFTARNNRMPKKVGKKVIHHPGYHAPTIKKRTNKIDPARGGRKAYAVMTKKETAELKKEIPKLLSDDAPVVKKVRLKAKAVSTN